MTSKQLHVKTSSRLTIFYIALIKSLKINESILFLAVFNDQIQRKSAEKLEKILVSNLGVANLSCKVVISKEVRRCIYQYHLYVSAYNA